MVRKIKANLKKKLVKAKVIETYEIGNEIYKVIDYTSPLPFIKDRRNLSFKIDNAIHSHSAIYFNPKYHFQPIFHIPQKIISVWGSINKVEKALVLGCAGCSVPRFISLHYPHSKTIGVELSADFISIAKKHFLIEQIEKQFTLIQGDAIEFVKNYSSVEKQNVIYIDIFDRNKVIDEIFTEEFIKGLYLCTDETALIVINIFGKDVDEAHSFFNNVSSSFSENFIIKSNNAQFAVLTKTNKADKSSIITSIEEALDGITIIK